MNTTSKSDSPHSPIAKPCPFCGGTTINFQPGEIKGSERLWCFTCGASSESWHNRHRILESWNRRSSSILEELEALEAELRAEREKLWAEKDIGAMCEADGFEDSADRLHALITSHQERKS